MTSQNGHALISRDVTNGKGDANGAGLQLLPALKPRRGLLSPEVCRGDAGELWARMMIVDDMRLLEDDDEPHGITGWDDPWFISDDPHRQDLEALRAAYGEWLLLPDGVQRYDQLDIALAVIVANRFKSSPLWLLMVAPPSSGKTETIETCTLAHDTYSLSTLTTKTLISGWNKTNEDGEEEDASLLPKLNGKVVLMKDLTTVLTMRNENRKEIFGQLREIYDGRFDPAWGTGKELKWKGKIGMLAGVTSVIDREYAFNAALGERFVLYRIPSVNRREQGRRALHQQLMGEDARRNHLQMVVANYLRNFLKPEMQEFPSVIEAGILALADYVARARTAAYFDGFGELSFVSDPEGPSRLAKQFALLAQALAVVRREQFVAKRTFRTVARVAYDTVPARRQALLATVIKHGDIDLPMAVKQTKLSDSMTRKELHAMVAHGLIDVQGREGKAQHWTMTESLKETMSDIERACGVPLGNKTYPGLTASRWGL